MEESQNHKRPSKMSKSSKDEEEAEAEGESCGIDNSMMVINKIANLYAERLMSDVILVVGNMEYPSHRLILCASSDVFQIMLMNRSWTESQEKRIVLKETPSGEAVFEDFLKYFYTGKIQFDYATVIPLVCLADKYNVKDLLRIGLDYMWRNVSTACKRNQVVSWYQFTSASGHIKVADPCRNFIKANFEMVAENVDFPNMDLATLISFIQCNDLVVKDEYTLFKCVDKWLLAQQEFMEHSGEDNIPIHMDHYVQEVIQHIRCPMMKPSQLPDLILNPLSKSHMELVLEKIRIAMAFHKNEISLEKIRRENLESKWFTPRLYTTERFCASLTVNHLHNLQSYHCRSLVFTSQRFMNEGQFEDNSDWVVDFYPKGVWFQKCLTVYQPLGLEVPGRVLKTVRVALSTREQIDELRVKVGLLFFGVQDGFEHVRKVVTRNFFFSSPDNQVLNVDDALDYDEINDVRQRSPFLCDDGLKLWIVITPLTELSSLELS